MFLLDQKENATSKSGTNQIIHILQWLKSELGGR